MGAILAWPHISRLALLATWCTVVAAAPVGTDADDAHRVLISAEPRAELADGEDAAWPAAAVDLETYGKKCCYCTPAGRPDLTCEVPAKKKSAQCARFVPTGCFSRANDSACAARARIAPGLLWEEEELHRRVQSIRARESTAIQDTPSMQREVSDVHFRIRRGGFEERRFAGCASSAISTAISSTTSCAGSVSGLLRQPGNDLRVASGSRRAEAQGTTSNTPLCQRQYSPLPPASDRTSDSRARRGEVSA